MQYASFLESLLERKLQPEDGTSALSKVVLPPAALKEFYQTAGNIWEVTRSHNCFYPPEKLQLEDGMLIFMEENQRVVYWGIREADLTIDDPPVFQGTNGKTIEWYPEEMIFSEWIRVMTCWQLANEGSKFGAYVGTVEGGTEKVSMCYPFITAHADGSTKYFGKPSQMICVAPTGKTASIWAAGRTLDDLKSIDSTLQITWDYSFLDEV